MRRPTLTAPARDDMGEARVGTKERLSDRTKELMKDSCVRASAIQLAWRFLLFQKNSALAQWFRARTENARGTRKLMIVALARRL